MTKLVYSTRSGPAFHFVDDSVFACLKVGESMELKHSSFTKLADRLVEMTGGAVPRQAI